jgi:shikimate dehydrogenase
MRIFGLIGYPLGHSFSKIFFTQKFKEQCIDDACFELFPIESIKDFPILITNNPGIEGLAVTKPHKETVIPYLTRLDEAATEIGAVNCIVIKNGELTGHNTDVIGFERSLLPLLQTHHKKALVLGTGGASKGVQFVLKMNGIEFLTVSRSQSANQGDIFYEQIDEQMIKEFTLIINTTPAGMTPDEEGCPDIPYQYISDRHLLYDLIYKPEETLFMKKGKDKGAIVKNGHEMFLIQAEANWLYWQGIMS